MDVVIPRNTTIPVEKTKEYVTDKDNQSSSLIKVYEGERIKASDNNLLGLFNFSFPPAPRGFPIKECFAIDADGILNVSAEEETSGSKKDITITNENGRLSNEEIERMILEAENYKAEDMKLQKKVKAMNALDDYLYVMRKVMKDKGVSSMLPALHKEKIDSAVTKGECFLDGNQGEETHVFVEFFRELESIFGSTLDQIKNEESD